MYSRNLYNKGYAVFIDASIQTKLVCFISYLVYSITVQIQAHFAVRTLRNLHLDVKLALMFWYNLILHFRINLAKILC